MNITDYCIENKIKTLPINLILNTEGKFYPCDSKPIDGNNGKFSDGRHNFIITDFKKMSLKQCQTYMGLYGHETEWIGIDTTVIQQMDIDDLTGKFWLPQTQEEIDNDDYKQPSISEYVDVPHFLSVIKNMPHYFIKTDLKNKKCNEIPFDHDVLGAGCWAWAHKDSEIIYSKCNIPTIELTGKTAEKAIEKTTKKTTVNKPVNKTTEKWNTFVTPFQEAILNNINQDEYYNYSEWKKFLWAIKFSFENDGIKVATHYSSQLNNYKDEADIINHFEQAKQKRIGWGYLMNLSKKSNIKNHYKIISNFTDVLKADDYYIAVIANKLVDDNVIKLEGNQFFIFDKPYWKIDTCGKLRAYICKLLREFYAHILQDIVKEMKEVTDNDEKSKALQLKRESLDKVVGKVNSSVHSKCIFDLFCINMEISSIDFDSYRPYYFCFDNCAFDLRDNQLVEIKREDYISQTTGYNYSISTPDQLQKIEELFKIIFPVEEERLCYISIMRCGLIGLVYEYFVLANGGGGNGKGLINSLLKRMMGTEYFYTASIATYVEKMKDGANPAIANMHKKRCIITSEPNDSEKLNLAVIKGLTGDGEINARGLYQSSTVVSLMCMQILECNKKPGFDGRIDDSIIRRFINIVFRSTFTFDASKLLLPNYFKAEPMYKHKDWQEEHKCALFQYLMQFNYIDIYQPPCVRKATYDYLCENDDFTLWLDQHYTLVDDKKQTIKLKAMCNNYKESFLRAGSREYRKLTKERFLEKLKENIKWKDVVSEKYVDNTKGQWFTGICEKITDDNDSDDEDADIEIY